MVSPPCNEFVTHSLHSDDQFRPTGVLLEFVTKAVYMHIHSSRKCSAVITPDGAQQLVTRNKASTPLNEVTEKPQLEVCEINRAAVSFHLGASEIDPKRAIVVIIAVEDTSKFLKDRHPSIWLHFKHRLETDFSPFTPSPFRHGHSLSPRQTTNRSLPPSDRKFGARIRGIAIPAHCRSTTELNWPPVRRQCWC